MCNQALLRRRPLYAKVDREWAVNNLLKDVSKQRKVVPDSDSRRQLAWVRAAYTADNQSHRCILLGLLFQPALVVKIFDVAIASLDEGLMRTASMGLVAINDIFAGLDSGECVKVAELALSVGVSPLHWLHSELINILASAMLNDWATPKAMGQSLP